MVRLLKKYNAFAFGGFVRGLINGETSRDIDIVAKGHDYRALVENFVLSKGFERTQDTSYYKLEFLSERNVFVSPSGFVFDLLKVNSNLPVKRVGLNGEEIDSTLGLRHYGVVIDERATSRKFCKFYISKVDIRCCAVSLDGSGEINEEIPGAIEDCNERWIVDTNNAEKKRLDKFLKRGWLIFSEDMLKTKVKLQICNQTNVLKTKVKFLEGF